MIKLDHSLKITDKVNVLLMDLPFLLFIFEQASSETTIRKRRKVLKSRTFMDDEGCIGGNEKMKCYFFLASIRTVLVRR